MESEQKRYRDAKRKLGFLQTTSSRRLSRSLGTFFEEVDALLSNEHRNDPPTIRMDPRLKARIGEITQNHSRRLWSTDKIARRRVLVDAGYYEQYPDDLYWDNEEHMQM